MAQISSGAETIGELKSDPAFATIEPADPGVTRKDLFPLREETETRLRKNLPAIIGTLSHFERNPAKVPAELSFRYEKKRNLQLAWWQADGPNGRAFALLDVFGGLRVHIVRDSNAPLLLAEEASLDGARKLLGLFWGGEPTGEPHRAMRSSWEWRGVDGLADDERTKVSVALNEESISQKWLTKEIFLTTGASFQEWKKLTVNELGRASGWLTKRAAIAGAIRQLDEGEVPDQPKRSADATIRSLEHCSSGWLVELELNGNVEKRFLMIGVADETGRTWTSSSSSQTSTLPRIADRIVSEEVRHWPEYRAAMAKQRGDARLFRPACDAVRPKIAAAIAAIRPDLKDLTERLRFSQDTYRNRAGGGSYVKSPNERVPLFGFSFEYGGSEPRLTTAVMIVPPNGQEPSMQDEQAWSQFGVKGIERIFGKARGAECEPVNAFHQAPPPSDPRNSQMTLDSIEVRLAAQVGGTRVSVPGYFRVERYVNGNYYFYWSCYSSPGEVDAALERMRSGLPTSEERAALIAAKGATLRYPDLPIDDWRVVRSELLLAPFSGGTADPTPGSSRKSPVIATRRFVFRQFPQALRYIEATVNATTGDLLELRARKTPVE